MATPPLRRAANVQTYVPFLRLETYSTGGGIPDGDYLWVDLSVLMHTPTKKDGTVVGAPRLAVRVTMDPPNGAQTVEERREQTYSMGTKAHLTYQPDPETAKRIIPIPGAPAASIYEGSNFNLLLKSLYDSGMPQDYAMDDLRSLEGILVHITSIDEPVERAGFRTQNQTEVQDAPKKPSKIPVVSQVIKAPWLGNMAAAAPVPLTKPAVPHAVTPISNVAASVVPVNGTPAPAAGQPILDEESAAVQAIMEILDASPGNKTSKLNLQTGAFRILKSHPGKQSIMNTYFANNDNLAALLSQLGYGINAGAIAPL